MSFFQELNIFLGDLAHNGMVSTVLGLYNLGYTIINGLNPLKTYYTNEIASNDTIKLGISIDEISTIEKEYRTKLGETHGNFQVASPVDFDRINSFFHQVRTYKIIGDYISDYNSSDKSSRSETRIKHLEYLIRIVENEIASADGAVTEIKDILKAKLKNNTWSGKETTEGYTFINQRIATLSEQLKKFEEVKDPNKYFEDIYKDASNKGKECSTLFERYSNLREKNLDLINLEREMFILKEKEKEVESMIQDITFDYERAKAHQYMEPDHHQFKNMTPLIRKLDFLKRLDDSISLIGTGVPILIPKPDIVENLELNEKISYLEIEKDIVEKTRKDVEKILEDTRAKQLEVQEYSEELAQSASSFQSSMIWSAGFLIFIRAIQYFLPLYSGISL